MKVISSISILGPKQKPDWKGLRKKVVVSSYEGEKESRERDREWEFSGNEKWKQLGEGKSLNVLLYL